MKMIESRLLVFFGGGEPCGAWIPPLSASPERYIVWYIIYIYNI